MLLAARLAHSRRKEDHRETIRAFGKATQGGTIGRAHADLHHDDSRLSATPAPSSCAMPIDGAYPDASRSRHPPDVACKWQSSRSCRGLTATRRSPPRVRTQLSAQNLDAGQRSTSVLLCASPLMKRQSVIAADGRTQSFPSSLEKLRDILGVTGGLSDQADCNAFEVIRQHDGTCRHDLCKRVCMHCYNAATKSWEECATLFMVNAFGVPTGQACAHAWLSTLSHAHVALSIRGPPKCVSVAVVVSVSVSVSLSLWLRLCPSLSLSVSHRYCRDETRTQCSCVILTNDHQRAWIASVCSGLFTSLTQWLSLSLFLSRSLMVVASVRSNEESQHRKLVFSTRHVTLYRATLT